MNKNILIAILVVIVLVLGGWWYSTQLNTKSSFSADSTSTTTEIKNVEKNSVPAAPSASIDKSSLVSSNGIFSIAGSAFGATKLYVYVTPNISPYATTSNLQSLLDLMHGGATAYVSNNTVVVTDGRWVTIPNKAGYAKGEYKVFVFDISNTSINQGRDIQPSCAPVSCGNVRLLASDTLVVE